MARGRRRASAKYQPVQLRDDAPVQFGGVAKLEWDSSDPNANLLLVDFPTGGATDVPVMLLATAGSDYGYLNGTTQPTLAIEDADQDSYAALSFSSDDVASLTVGGGCSTMGITAATTNIAASTLATIYGAATQIGFDSGAYMKIAVTDTTGAVAITHAGSGKAVTWTTTGGFSFVGDTAITGTLGCSGTLSVGLDATAGTLELYPATTNSGTTTLTMEDNSGDTITNINVATQSGARTYTIPDAGASADFLMTDSYKTWWSFAVGLAGEDTDGLFTNSGGMAGGVPDSTTNQYNDGGGTVYVKVYDLTSTTWDDLSTSALLSGGVDWTNNYQLLPDADAEEAGDAFAIGFDSKFCEFGFNDLASGAGALATWGGDGGKWQYSTGADTWSDITTIFDNTDSVAQDGLQSLTRVGTISFAPPSDWVMATYDGQEAYWVQYVLTGAQLTQTPLIDSVAKDEPFIIVAGSDSFSAPFKATIGKIRMTDMGDTVHDQAIQFVVGNFTTGVFTEEFTWTASQYNDTFTPSTPLAVAADDVIGICITDDGGSTVNPVIYAEFEATYLN